MNVLEVLLGIVVLLTVLIVLGYIGNGLVVLREYERGVVFRWGRLEKVLAPGLHFLTPVSRTLVRVELRTKTIDIPAQ